jgi:hypothetical protein
MRVQTPAMPVGQRDGSVKTRPAEWTMPWAPLPLKKLKELLEVRSI